MGPPRYSEKTCQAATSTAEITEPIAQLTCYLDGLGENNHSPFTEPREIGNLNPSPECEIRNRIVKKGQITFAEFMELALYHPEGGYYSLLRTSSAPADYYTSPQAHPAFGALIAIQLCRMWELLGKPSPFHAVEIGSGNGLLAHDIWLYTSHLPRAFADSLQYTAIDKFPQRTSDHEVQTAISQIGSSESPPMNIQGCVLSNELIDSFPVHRFQIEGSLVKEVFVTLVNGQLREKLDDPSTPLIKQRLHSLTEPLPAGFSGEVNLQIGHWIGQVSNILRKGFVLTIDYGYEAKDLYSTKRMGGTLKTHYAHTTGTHFYQHIGMQDITAHVDFTSLIQKGFAVGLRSIAFCNQAKFLQDLGVNRWLHSIRSKNIAQREWEANSMAIRNLVSHDGLGQFKVLIQEKDTGIEDARELLPITTTGKGKRWSRNLRPPLLRAEHSRLMEARYPHLNFPPESM